MPRDSKLKVAQKSIDAPFDLRSNRAMISIGPLSEKKYCAYSCPFCYVHANFLSYASLTLEQTIDWIESKKNQFDIIYISGDTDSFAYPRTDEGLDLLEAVLKFNVDVLFTTRAVFDNSQLKRISDAREYLKNRGKLLFGCVSIAQLYNQYLEPKPIKPPVERIEQLFKFKEMGLISIHAMRPFLPVVPIEEYLELIDRVANGIDIILGEVWYADKSGLLEEGVFRNNAPSDLLYKNHRMDFDDNEVEWKVWEAKHVQKSVRQKCKTLKIPFFMRSQPAIEWSRKTFNTKQK